MTSAHKTNGTRQTVHAQVATGRQNLIYYIRDDIDSLRTRLRTEQKAFDKDGVITNNDAALHYADQRSFKEHNVEYRITVGTRGWLETLKDHNASVLPYQDILAVNKISQELCTGGRLTPERTLAIIRRRHADPEETLGSYRTQLTEQELALARKIFDHRVAHSYRLPETARYIREAPGAAKAFLEIVRFSEREGAGIQTHVVTSTETKEMVRQHFEAAFLAAGHGIEVLREVEQKVGIISAEDVPQIKPDPTGLFMIKNGRPLIFSGDGHSDAKAVEEARRKGMRDVEFCAIVDNPSRIDEFMQYGPLAIVSHLGVFAEMLR